MTAGAVPLAFVAGVLSILSPCVLPILPIVLGAAASEHRFGPAALAAGLSASFVVIGLFAATIGYSIGLDLGVFRNVAAALVDKQIPEQAKELGISEQDVIKNVMLKDTVDGEFTKVEDVAEAALFFAAFNSNALTGQSLIVSHGWFIE